MNLKKISNRIISPKTSIISALKKMDSNECKLLIVLENKHFISVLSIGDIQRAIINNYKLTADTSKILRRDITIATDNMTFDEIKKVMINNRIEFMPVINSKGELVDVYFWEDIFGRKKRIKTRNLNLPVIIMAGGKGTRLKPITNILPKPLIPIGEKTILEEIMIRFQNAGCKQFFISVNYKADMIKYYFSTLEDDKFNMVFFQENKPLGTAGSLHLLNGEINSTFFVTNCDIIIEQDLTEIYDYHIKNKNEMTVVVALKSYQVPYGTVTSGENGLLLDLIEKPEIIYKINSGVYLLEPHLLNEIPTDQFFHITDLIQTILKRNGRIGVFPVSEKSWKDIGEWDEYLKNTV